MRIVLIYTHTRRCGPHFYKLALRNMGHRVISIGPWKADEPFGERGREPDIALPTIESHAYDYDWIRRMLARVQSAHSDLLVLVDGGESLRVTGIPAELPWIHISTEGNDMAWSRGLTPHRYAEIMRSGMDDGITWLPKAFDPQECRGYLLPKVLRLRPIEVREYDLVQLASARDARRYVWDEVKRRAPDLHTVFGDIWGPLYACAYQNALATYVCHTLDFVTTRVFEAMAMGCVVISDRTPCMLKLFQEDVHFVGYEGEPGPGGEDIPPIDWLIETVRRLRRDGDDGMAQRAYELVRSRDSYEHRMKQVLEAL